MPLPSSLEQRHDWRCPVSSCFHTFSHSAAADFDICPRVPHAMVAPLSPQCAFRALQSVSVDSVLPPESLTKWDVCRGRRKTSFWLEFIADFHHRYHREKGRLIKRDVVAESVKSWTCSGGRFLSKCSGNTKSSEEHDVVFAFAGEKNC